MTRGAGRTAVGTLPSTSLVDHPVIYQWSAAQLGDARTWIVPVYTPGRAAPVCAALRSALKTTNSFTSPPGLLTVMTEAVLVQLEKAVTMAVPVEPTPH